MLKLIELVLRNPILYDASDLYYKNTIKKEETWFMIAEELEEDPVLVKKRWKNLRDSYLKHLKGVRYKYWEWAKYMKPFQPYLRTSTPINLKEYEERYCSSDLPHPIFEETNYTDSSTRESKSDNEIDEFLIRKDKLVDEPVSSQDCKNKRFFHFEKPSESPIRSPSAKRSRNNLMRKSLENRRRRHFDATDHMFLAFAKTIKDFPLQRQLEVKHEIANIIMRNERENLVSEQEMVDFNHNSEVIDDEVS